MRDMLLSALTLATISALLAASPYLAAFVTPCQYEDSTNCYWDADQFGNQTGSSFVDIGGRAFRIP